MRICVVMLFAAALPLRALAAPASAPVSPPISATASPAANSAISPAEALHHIGGVMTVEGVASITTPSTGTVTFVEIGVPGNSVTLQGVILDGDHGKFPDLASYNGKKVQLTGPVQTFKGMMRIILTRPDQMKLAE